MRRQFRPVVRDATLESRALLSQVIPTQPVPTVSVGTPMDPSFNPSDPGTPTTIDKQVPIIGSFPTPTPGSC